LVFIRTAFSVRMSSIRAETRLARAARKSARGIDGPAVVQCCADEDPSARIADCARMKSHPSAIADLV